MIWRGIGRIVLVAIGFVLAAVMATLVIGTLGLERFTQEMSRQGRADGMIELIWAIATNAGALSKLSAASTIVPSLIAVVIGEVARIRSALYYILAGGLALAAIPFLIAVGQVTAPPAAVWQVLATAGFAGGFIYWLIAGRSA
jgi:hypothetical protein